MTPARAPGSTVAPDRPETAPPAALRQSRRSALAGAFAAACGLGACSARPAPVAAPVVARRGGALVDLNDDAPDLVVAGERLDAGLLRRFYARRDFQPVWASRQAQADALVDTVLRAGDHGLDPDMFHASLLRRRATFPPLRRELLLSDAILSYADALAHGAVPVGRRKDNEALAPAPLDVAGVLDAAIGGRDAAAAIEALAPATPTYRALRDALRRHRPGGAPAGRNAAVNRLLTIEVNLERQRWLPRSLPADRVWVNVADQRLVLYRADRPVFSTRVVVGEVAERKQSPEFGAIIEASFFNPPWVIPRDIVAADILPRLTRDPDYLARHDMILRDNGEVEQRAGPEAGLGVIMFDMPNRFDVYLHDTPDRSVFGRDNRRISNGCIRVQDPLEFAALLYDRPIDVIQQGVATGTTTRSSLPKPVPVFVIYQTAFADAGDAVQFRPDFYNRDAEIGRKLHHRPDGRNPPVLANGPPASPSAIW